MYKIKRISSPQNLLFKELVNLKKSAACRRKANKALIDGKTLVLDYIKKFGLEEVNVIVSSSFFESQTEYLKGIFPKSEISLFSDRLYSKFATQTHSQAMSAIISTQRVIKILSENRRESQLILVDGVQDPGNLGAIIRLAAAFDFDQVLVSEASCDPWSPKCIRGGMGGQFVISCKKVNIRDILETFSGERIALSANNGDSIYKKMAFADKTLFLIGGEGRGINPELRDFVDCSLTVPINCSIESLNVSSSLAIALYEFCRSKSLNYNKV